VGRRGHGGGGGGVGGPAGVLRAVLRVETRGCKGPRRVPGRCRRGRGAGGTPLTSSKMAKGWSMLVGWGPAPEHSVGDTVLVRRGWEHATQALYEVPVLLGTTLSQVSA
jgi:hypothetical protein